MFEVRFSRRAERNLDDLSAEDRQRVIEAIEELSRDGLAARHVTTLFYPQERLYRKRVGPLRIVFSMDFDSEVVSIVALGRRGSVYRAL